MASMRTKDAAGRLFVRLTPISRAIVTNYRGSEVPDWQALGLDPEWVYRIYRHPIELAHGAASFVGAPILSRHIAISVPPPPELIIGEVGGPAEMLFTTLLAPISIWDLAAVAAIESGERRCLSASYHYDYVAEPGVAPDGKAFDGRMTNIRAHHVAHVVYGRVWGACVAP